MLKNINVVNNMRIIKLKDVLAEKKINNYDIYFTSMLKKYGVSSPSELSDEDKKKFFDDVDAGWDTGKNGMDVDEMSSVSAMGGGDGYQTPFAFSKRVLNPSKKTSIEKNGAKVIGENIEPNPKDSPKKHIANYVRKIRHQLHEVEKIIDESKTFKENSGLKSSDFYKRTNTNLKKIGEQIYRIINKMQTIK